MGIEREQLIMDLEERIS